MAKVGMCLGSFTGDTGLTSGKFMSMGQEVVRNGEARRSRCWPCPALPLCRSFFQRGPLVGNTLPTGIESPNDLRTVLHLFLLFGIAPIKCSNLIECHVHAPRSQSGGLAHTESGSVRLFES